MLPPVLLDTNVIFAALNRSDRDHARCVAALERTSRPLVTCEPVIVEACYLCRTKPTAAERILSNVANGIFQIPLRLAECAVLVRDLMLKYSDTPCDLADACLIQLADVLNTGDILTLDSHFRHYRWRRNRRFNLLIPLD